jgi:tol-pal system protein YbgF
MGSAARPSLRPTWLPVLAVLGALPTLGCGHGQTAADRSIEQLRADLGKVQADHDRLEERLGAVEAEQSKLDQNSAAPTPGGGPRRERGPLKVVRIDATGQPAAAEAPADAALLAGEGEALDTEEGPERPIVTATGTRRSAGAPSALLPEAKRDYDSALAQVKGKQYDPAIATLSAFLVRYPDHPNANNAMYWRGECFYAKGDYTRAAEEFEGLVARFPLGLKVPDALLKLGMSQQKLGQNDRADRTFAQLRERYPKSPAARQLMRR